MVRELNGRRLNSSQIAFAQGVADGHNQLQAYRSAYPKSSPRSARANATRLMEKPEIASYVEEMREKTETEKTLTRQGKREILARIALDESAPLGARLRAIDLDNKMAGHYEPEKVAYKFTVSLADRISERNRERKNVICIPPEY